jgi:hypothetical protein
LTQGGVLPTKTDFTGYVPKGGSSENGFLSINSETAPGGVTILDIDYDTTYNIWQTSRSEAIDFSSVIGTIANCSGTVTPWNTIISCEELTSIELETRPGFEYPKDVNNDGYHDFGWAIEIDPVTKTVVDQEGGLNGPDKLWAMGNFKHENAVVHSNQRTIYQGADAQIGHLYKFVADSPKNLSSGSLYVYSGSKSGSGNWIQINNTTQAEQNSTIAQSIDAGATVFEGIEDVEIGPDGKVYFAVKGEGRVYRFQDSDPVSGTIVTQMETYVGNATYAITHSNGTTNHEWGFGNDNLAFDGEGNLWVLQDRDTSNNYIWVVESGHSQAVPKVKIFGRPPVGSEPTGITFSPDFRFLFMSIQHPSSSNNSTSQTDAAGNEVSFDKGTSLVISLKESPDLVWYLDSDGDQYAAVSTVSSPTSPGTGYTTTVLPTTDCDDGNAAINPESIWYLDADDDGFAAPTTMERCTSPGVGYTLNVLPRTDCDDSDQDINEISTWYLDADGDGFAHPTTTENCGSPGMGYTINILPTTDCDDGKAEINPETIWYLDADADGFADPMTMEGCSSPGEGYTTNVLPTTDCDDSDESVNLTTLWYLDSDEDGFADAAPLMSCNSPGADYTTQELPIKEIIPEDGILYPNPSRGNVVIALGKSYKEVRVDVLSPVRQLLFSEDLGEVDTIPIDMSTYSSSLYFVQLISEGRRIGFYKVIKL